MHAPLQSMKIYLLRHGEAEPHAATDRNRQLTARGRDDVRQVITDIAAELRDVSLVIASPYVRAQQTADIAYDVIAVAGQVQIHRETSEALVPDAFLTDFFAMLQQCSVDAVLLVSHQPLVGKIVEQLCGKSAAEYAMSTANLVRIDCDYPAADCGTFCWIKRPLG